MFQSPPREKSWVSWLYVVIWSLFIFVTIPLARMVQEFVRQQWGRETFTHVVIVSILLGLVASVFYLRKHRSTFRGNTVWLLAVTGIFIGYTIKLGKVNPEESIHFTQYGLLGILAFRALTHRLGDLSIYFAAALICGIVGILDEVVQWITPGRHWGLKDIWLNFFAASLVQVGIAKGLKPPIISGWPSRANLRLVVRIAMVAVVLFGANLLNTPARISWYAEQIPWLAFLKENESMMLEYGYLYNDPGIGVFRSRLSPEELKRSDQERGKEAADILDRFRERDAYQFFLEIYTPVSDPFVHEARVHLFRRDRHFARSEKYKNDPEKYAEYLNTAFRENQIMEKYFPNTLRHSAYVWSSDKLALARTQLLRDEKYDSWVSRRLFTGIKERHLASFLAFLLGCLAILHWYLGREK